MMKILGMTGGEHSCGLSVTYDGKPILALEEERHSRTKAYNDLYNNIYRYPWESGQNVWFIKDWDWLDLDYITSPETPEVFEKIWAGIGLGPFPREKYIKVNNHQEFELMKDYKPQMYENMLNNFQDWVLSQSLCDVVE